MKCKDCNCAKKGFFSSQPEAYVCTGVKEPFVIGDINSECTEYESKRNMKMTREEAIQMLKLYNDIIYKPMKMKEALDIAIELLGNDTNVGSKWIPCSEKLPECENGCETKALMFQIKSSDYIEVGYYGEGGKYRDRYFRTYTDTLEGYEASDVIAWQPLPEPYKEGDT